MNVNAGHCFLPWKLSLRFFFVLEKQWTTTVHPRGTVCPTRVIICPTGLIMSW